MRSRIRSVVRMLCRSGTRRKKKKMRPWVKRARRVLRRPTMKLALAVSADSARVGGPLVRSTRRR